VAWLWLILLALAVAVLVAAEWPRLSARLGPERWRLRARSRRKEQLRIVRSDDEIDEFAASVERDLAQLPTTRDRDR
jgi:predicted nucleic acid-binding protein